MKRNAKLKQFATMLDILCDFLIATKEVGKGVGVQWPKQAEGSPPRTAATISPSKAEAQK